MPFKKLNDTLLDILGWIMTIAAGYRIIVIALIGEPSFKVLIPLGAICLFGIILIWITIKKVGGDGWDFIKKKFNK